MKTDVTENLKYLCARLDSLAHVDTNRQGSFGWGQFLNEGRNQVGFYGVFAGMHFKTLVCPDEPIDVKLSKYAKELWRNSDSKSKYFQGNIRLTYLVYALGRARDERLAQVLREAEKELIKRQLENGGWPEHKNSSLFSAIDTAFASLALNNCSSIAANESAKKGVLKLMSHYDELPEKQLKIAEDGIVYAAILQVGIGKKLAANFLGGAFRKLDELKTAHAIRVYHFDFEKNSQGAEMSRDYLCVPHVYLRYLISSGLVNSTKYSLSYMKAGIHHTSCVEEAKELFNDGFFRIASGHSPATLDQAFLAQGVHELDSVDKSGFGIYNVLRKINKFLKKRWILRTLTATFIVTAAAISAQNPELMNSVLKKVTFLETSNVQVFIKNNGSIIQVVGIFVAFFFGQMLLKYIVNALKERGRDL